MAYQDPKSRMHKQESTGESVRSAVRKESIVELKSALAVISQQNVQKREKKGIVFELPSHLDDGNSPTAVNRNHSLAKQRTGEIGSSKDGKSAKVLKHLAKSMSVKKDKVQFDSNGHMVEQLEVRSDQTTPLQTDTSSEVGSAEMHDPDPGFQSFAKGISP